MADRTDKDPRRCFTDVPPEVAEQLVHQLMDRLISPIPRSARRHVGKPNTATGREILKRTPEVADWLKYLENQSAKHHIPPTHSNL